MNYFVVEVAEIVELTENTLVIGGVTRWEPDGRLVIGDDIEFGATKHIIELFDGPHDGSAFTFGCGVGALCEIQLGTDERDRMFVIANLLREDGSETILGGISLKYER